MLQSGVGSMQGFNKDCLPIKGHTQGGDTPTVLPIEWTHSEGERTHPQCNPTNGHTYFHRGGTHPQCNITKIRKILTASKKKLFIMDISSSWFK